MSYRFYSSADFNNSYSIYDGLYPILDILDLCLVYGYSGKPSLGWELVQRSATHRVYRAAGGTQRKFFRISHDGVTNSGRFTINVLDSISPDTGAWFSTDTPGSSITSVRNLTFSKAANSAVSAVTNPPWIVCGDDKFFTVLATTVVTGTPSTTSLPFIFFGENNGITFLNILNAVSAGSSTSTYRMLSANSVKLQYNSAGAFLFADLAKYSDNQNPIAGYVDTSYTDSGLATRPSLETTQKVLPCTLSQNVYGSISSAAVHVGSIEYTDASSASQGIMMYSPIYFTTFHTITSSTGSTSVNIGVHPHIMALCSTPVGPYNMSNIPFNDRIRNTPPLYIDGVPYLLLTMNDTVTLSSPNLLIRLE